MPKKAKPKQSLAAKNRRKAKTGSRRRIENDPAGEKVARELFEAIAAMVRPSLKNRFGNKRDR